MARDTETFRPTLPSIPSSGPIYSHNHSGPDTPPPTPTGFAAVSSHTHAFKKRLSDSLTDIFAIPALHRRRPSLQQGPSSSSSKSANSNGSKPRSRASSTSATGTPTHPRNPPPLNQSASMATITSSSSASSSYKGSLSRRESYSDIVTRGFPQPPLGLGLAKEGQMGGAQAIPVSEPGRAVFGQKIMSAEDFREEEEDHFADVQSEWKTSSEGGSYASGIAATEAETNRIPGITRKISDSRRIIRPPSSDSREDGGGGEFVLAEEMEQKVVTRDQLGIPSRPPLGGRRESSMTVASSTVQGYISSSDEASTGTSSSLKSARSRSSTTGASGQASLPQAASHSQPRNRGSKLQVVPPPLDLQTWSDKGGSASSASATSVSDKQPGSRPQTVPPSRSATASPLKYANLSARNKQSGALEVPTPSATPGSPGSRLSSLASPIGTVSIAGPRARSISTTALNSMVVRSDSSTSLATAPIYPPKSVPPASTTTPVNTIRHPKYLTSRDRKDSSSKFSLASHAASASKNRVRHPPSLEPPLPGAGSAPSVPQAPASGMYWYKAPTHGQEHMPLRAHTCTLVGSNIFVFGGCDVRTCFNDLYVFDAGKRWNFSHRQVSR